MHFTRSSTPLGVTDRSIGQECYGANWGWLLRLPALKGKGRGGTMGRARSCSSGVCKSETQMAMYLLARCSAQCPCARKNSNKRVLFHASRARRGSGGAPASGAAPTNPAPGPAEPAKIPLGAADFQCNENLTAPSGKQRVLRQQTFASTPSAARLRAAGRVQKRPPSTKCAS